LEAGAHLFRRDVVRVPGAGAGVRGPVDVTMSARPTP
jgi:hypothetical protein